MFSRRQLLAGGVAAGALGAADVSETAQASDSEYLARMLDELRGIRRAVSVEGAQAVAQIRLARRSHLKNTGRFPEFVDVGFDVFESAADWLVAVQQPVAITRTGDGRYTLPLFATTIVLRPDFPDNYVGQGYDK
jgi:hypothetical protein